MTANYDGRFFPDPSVHAVLTHDGSIVSFSMRTYGRARKIFESAVMLSGRLWRPMNTERIHDGRNFSFCHGVMFLFFRVEQGDPKSMEENL